MYEHLTYETILNRMTERIKAISNVDVSEGSLLFTAIAPEAFELSQAYLAIDEVYDYTFADTAPREELILRAKERGKYPKEATKAILKATIDGAVTVGMRFSLNDLTYAVTENQGVNTWLVECETAGTVGNRYTGALTALQFIDGMTGAKITEVVIPAEDEEDTEVFRQRYFASFDNQSFGGNRADYLNKVGAIQGVGACKVHRSKDTKGTVEVEIINSLYEPPTTELIKLVQNTLDPSDGAGDGLAPIGHKVVVSGVEKVVVNVGFTLTLESGSYEDIKTAVNNAVEEYLLSVRKEWSTRDFLTVRISQLESKILTVPNVLDITGTTINGSPSNLVLESNQVPLRGEVNAIS